MLMAIEQQLVIAAKPSAFGGRLHTNEPQPRHRLRNRIVALVGVRIISVGRPSCTVTTGCLAKIKRARGRENREKISPNITARNDMPVKISTVAMRCP